MPLLGVDDKAFEALILTQSQRDDLSEIQRQHVARTVNDGYRRSQLTNDKFPARSG